jgi:hypothetical protein
MPDMTGVEFRKRARLVWADIDSTFAFVTGDSAEYFLEGIGGAALFVKPVDETFVAFLRKCRDRSH